MSLSCAAPWPSSSMRCPRRCCRMASDSGSTPDAVTQSPPRDFCCLSEEDAEARALSDAVLTPPVWKDAVLAEHPRARREDEDVLAGAAAARAATVEAIIIVADDITVGSRVPVPARVVVAS